MKKALVTGSHGLVGSEMVKLLCDEGFKVFGIDNDTRAYLFGKEASTQSIGDQLKEKYPDNYVAINCDIRDREMIEDIFVTSSEFDFIVHCAAQPAHDWSTDHPFEDLEINAVGTINVLQMYRKYSPKAPFIHVSSSKVYGDHVNRLPLMETPRRFELPREHKWYNGVDETMSIDQSTHSLFGVSKAAGDLIAQEYGRYFDLPIVIFRPVCITGAAHKGAKLHGYLAYLAKCVAEGIEYTVNGYGARQVRDNIHAYDLVQAFYEVYKNPTHIVPGRVYNIGGGRKSNNSMIEAIEQFEKILKKKAKWKYSQLNRKGDHMWCIFSSKRFERDFPNWKLTYDNDRIMQDLCAPYMI